jgi:TolA-binding protein
MYLKAFEHLLGGDFRLAASAWEQVLTDYPTDLLAIRACHDACKSSLTACD